MSSVNEDDEIESDYDMLPYVDNRDTKPSSSLSPLKLFLNGLLKHSDYFDTTGNSKVQFNNLGKPIEDNHYSPSRVLFDESDDESSTSDDIDNVCNDTWIDVSNEDAKSYCQYNENRIKSLANNSTWTAVTESEAVSKSTQENKWKEELNNCVGKRDKFIRWKKEQKRKQMTENKIKCLDQLRCDPSFSTGHILVESNWSVIGVPTSILEFEFEKLILADLIANNTGIAIQNAAIVYYITKLL